MRRSEKLRDPKELAQWICNEIIGDCDDCKLKDKCKKGANAIEKMLNEEVPGKKNRECVSCNKLFDCFGKPDGMEDGCLNYEERK